MRFFRLLILSVILLTGLFSVSAEEDPITAFLAEQQLSLPAQFSFQQQRFINGLPRPLISSGELTIAEGVIEWHTQQPVAQHLTISATGIVDAQQDQALRGGEIIANILLAVLSGNVQSIDQHFSIAVNNDCAQLTPRSTALSQFVAYLNTCGNPQLERIELHERNGNHSVITLTPNTAEPTQSE